MAQKTYYKNLLSLNALAFISNAEAYPTVAYADFHTEAKGTTGIFLEDGTAKTNALAAGDKFFIAQVVDDNGTIKRSPVISFDQVESIEAQNYVAPVDQEDEITISAGASSAADELYLTAYNLSTGNQPFPTDEFSFIASTGSETAAQIAAAILTDYDKKRRGLTGSKPDVIVDYRVTGTRTQFAAAISITKGSKSLTGTGIGTAASVGDIVMINNYAFTVAATPGANEITLDRPYEHATVSALANTDPDSGTYDTITAHKIVFTSRYKDVHFQTAAAGDIATSIAKNTAWKFGNGFYEMVKQIENQSNTLDGNTYDNIENAEDWGTGPELAAVGTTYDLIFFTVDKKIHSVAPPLEYNSKKAFYILAVPSTGYTQGTLETVLGVTLT